MKLAVTKSIGYSIERNDIIVTYTNITYTSGQDRKPSSHRVGGRLLDVLVVELLEIDFHLEQVVPQLPVIRRVAEILRYL